MKTLFTTVALLSLHSFCTAQPISIEAARLADTFIEHTWPSQQKAIPLVIAGLQSQLKATGVNESATKVFGEELIRSMTKDNMSKMLAQGLTEVMSEAEQKEINAFLLTKTGQKYLKFSNDLTVNNQYTMTMLKQACVASNARLGSSDRSSIVGICGSY